MDILKDDFVISTDKTRLDIPFIHQYLARSYWAEDVPVAIVEKSIEGSLCFGIYYKDMQVGFARVITDNATFGYLADVFIIEAYRGKGLSKWLMQIIMEHESLLGLRRFMLATRDAHGLYTQFGFSPLTNPERLMQIVKPDMYKIKKG